MYRLRLIGRTHFEHATTVSRLLRDPIYFSGMCQCSTVDEKRTATATEETRTFFVLYQWPTQSAVHPRPPAKHNAGFQVGARRSLFHSPIRMAANFNLPPGTALAVVSARQAPLPSVATIHDGVLRSTEGEVTLSRDAYTLLAQTFVQVHRCSACTRTHNTHPHPHAHLES